MRKIACLFVPFLFVACGPGGEAGKGALAAPKTPVGDVISLTGPAGKVRLGDPLSQAKAAFPPPKGAGTFDKPMSYAMIAKEGWAWSLDAKSQAFEAALKDGKVMALSTMEGGPSDLQKSVAELGEPTRKADGKVMSAYVWEAGDDARFVVSIKKQMAFLPAGTLVLIGKKADLKLMNYHAEDPALMVRQMDAAAEQMNSPEFKKAIEDAKLKGKG